MLTEKQLAELQEIQIERDRLENATMALLDRARQFVQPFKDKNDRQALQDVLPFLPGVTRAFVRDWLRQNPEPEGM